MHVTSSGSNLHSTSANKGRLFAFFKTNIINFCYSQSLCQQSIIMCFKSCATHTLLCLLFYFSVKFETTCNHIVPLKLLWVRFLQVCQHTWVTKAASVPFFFTHLQKQDFHYVNSSYYIFQVLCVLWLVNQAVCILKYRPINFMVSFLAWFNFQEIR